jgi:O-antigen/teichoic acid export membrane protein
MKLQHFSLFTSYNSYIMQQLVRSIIKEKSNIFSITTTSFTSIFTSFFLVIAFANLLDPQSLGVYQYIIAVVSIIGALSLTGINPAIIRAAGKKDYHFFPTAFRYTRLSLLLPLTICVAVSGYYLYKGNLILGFGLLLPIIFSLTSQYLLRYNAIYVGIEKFKQSNYLLKASALAPIFVLFPALFFIDNPAILATLYFGSVATAIGLVVFFLQMPAKVTELVSSSIRLNDIKEYVTFSIHQSIITVLNILSSQFDKILIFQLLGAKETAIYYVSTSIPDRIRSVINQFQPYLFSKFGTHSPDTVRDVISFRFFILIILIVPIFLIYVTTAPLFFTYVLPQYADTVMYTIIYSFTLFAGAAIVPYSAMQAHGSDKKFYFYTVTSNILRICLIVLGVFYYELEGAIIGATAASLTNTCILYLISKIKDRNKIQPLAKD